MNAAGASRAGGSWTAGLELRGFVGIHLPTGAPGLPARASGRRRARPPRGDMLTPSRSSPGRPRRYRIHARERKRRNRPQPAANGRISLLRLRSDCSFSRRESAVGRRDLKAHPRRHNRGVPRRQQSRSLAVDDGFPSSSPQHPSPGRKTHVLASIELVAASRTPGSCKRPRDGRVPDDGLSSRRAKQPPRRGGRSRRQAVTCAGQAAVGNRPDKPTRGCLRRPAIPQTTVALLLSATGDPGVAEVVCPG
jgi:hypothetical protein